MTDFLMDTSPLPLVIGAEGDAEIEQNIRMIVRTFGFEVRMDNRFADKGAYLDAPLPFAAAQRIANLTEAIETYEPRVKVISLEFSPDADAAADGKLYPVLRYAKKEGAA
ncbi:GPW/gp25 family protein [Desulfosarcina sp. OttesenSCG-928-A07]|nr:GPW/gp25 family protein [Desulfosarcina sp. OttesenSCG-928-G17]MDL2329096.1 GPW/gp25 family protein [Desulfosarcina sp. OttesenSCG-928-A07]